MCTTHAHSNWATLLAPPPLLNIKLGARQVSLTYNLRTQEAVVKGFLISDQPGLLECIQGSLGYRMSLVFVVVVVRQCAACI